MTPSLFRTEGVLKACALRDGALADVFAMARLSVEARGGIRRTAAAIARRNSLG